MKRYRQNRLTAIVAILGLICGTAAAQEVTVTHAQGETTVPVDPEVVFSFDYAAIDALTALGVEVDGMPPLAGGGANYGDEDTLNIGSLFEPDYEAISTAEPDLIIIAGRSAEAYPDLSRIAPPSTCHSAARTSWETSPATPKSWPRFSTSRRRPRRASRRSTRKSERYGHGLPTGATVSSS